MGRLDRRSLDLIDACNWVEEALEQAGCRAPPSSVLDFVRVLGAASILAAPPEEIVDIALTF